jgi:DNA repair ATPase RecN
MRYVQKSKRTLFFVFCIVLLAACSNTDSQDRDQTYTNNTFDQIEEGVGFRKDNVERKISHHIEDIGDYLEKIDTSNEEEGLSKESLKQYREDLERLKKSLYAIKSDVEDGEDQINKKLNQRIQLVEDELMQIKMQIDEKLATEP